MAGQGGQEWVLVIEDDLDIGDVLELLLQTEGYHVVHAGNGVQALEALRDTPTPPALILLDLRMPLMNGWQFRELQQGDPRTAAIPVVVVSADSAAVRGNTLEGCAGYLAKPFLMKELREILRRVLGPGRESWALRLPERDG